MASGKLSPRQKMINLMYLVLIAMLALNMSKEVLTAFGLLNDKLTGSNVAATARNNDLMTQLAEKASEQAKTYAPLKAKADKIATISDDFNAYLESLKKDIEVEGGFERDEEGNLPYELMDKGDYVDEKWFNADKLSKKGQEIMDKIKGFREGVVNVLKEGSNDLPDFQADIMKNFATDKVKANDGANKLWLDYHYKGFPAIASITKLSQLQADVKTMQSEVMSAMFQGSLKRAASLSAFEAMVVPDKTAFFSGEKFTGKVILGKKDPNLKAHQVMVNGEKLPDSSMKAGQTMLSFPAGAVGEREINGEFQFKEGDSIVKIPIKGSYAVVPKPNSATIAADKMNVVYRGVQNPMTISFAGVSDNKVSASAPGLKKVAGVGKYVMSPGKGREVTINVRGTLPDGTGVSDAAKFRIKDIPAPTGKVRGQSGYTKMSKAGTAKATVTAVLEDFDFNLKLKVSGFKFKVPGQPTITCSGSRLNSRAKSALNRAKRGSTVTVFDINAKIDGNSGYKLKKVAPVTIEITN